MATIEYDEDTQFPILVLRECVKGPGALVLTCCFGKMICSSFLEGDVAGLMDKDNWRMLSNEHYSQYLKLLLGNLRASAASSDGNGDEA